MATPQDVIREYLVRLGFDFDTGGLNRVLNELSTAQSKASSMISKMSRNLGASFAGISSVIVSANVALGAFVTNVAQADLQTQIAARKMFINADAYRSMEQAAEALGYSMQDLTNIAMSPELTAQFRELVQLSQETVAPKELDNQLKQVRSIMFEFNRLKILVQNGMRQVTSDFLDILGEDLKTIKENLRSFVNRIQDQLPRISRGIAELLVYVLRAGNMLLNVIRFVGMLSNKVFTFLNQFPGAIKVAVSAVVAAFALMNPGLTAAIVGVGGLMALIDDYMVWTQGGNSYFGDSWEKVEKIASNISHYLGIAFELLYNGIIKAKDYILEYGTDIFKIWFGNVTELTGPIGEVLEEIVDVGRDILPPLLRSVTDTIKTVLLGVGDIIRQVSPFIGKIASEIGKLVTTIMNKIVTPCIDMFNKFLQDVSPIISEVAGKITEVIANSVLPAINKIVDVLSPVLTWLVDYVLTELTLAIYNLGKAVEVLIIEPLGWIADSLGTIFEDARRIFVYLFGDFKKVSESTDEWKTKLDSIWDVIGKIVKALKWILFPITGASDFANWLDEKTGWRGKMDESIEEGTNPGSYVQKGLSNSQSYLSDEFGKYNDSVYGINNYASGYDILEQYEKNRQSTKAGMIDALNNVTGNYYSESLTLTKENLKSTNNYMDLVQSSLTQFRTNATDNAQMMNNIMANLLGRSNTAQTANQISSSTISNTDNTRNTNNNTVNQNITVNNSGFNNSNSYLGSAARAAQTMLTSMMLSPTSR